MLARLFEHLFRADGLVYRQTRVRGFWIRHLVQAGPDLIVGLLVLPIPFVLQQFYKAVSGATVGGMPMPVAGLFLVYVLLLLAYYGTFTVLLLEILDTLKRGTRSTLYNIGYFIFALATVFPIMALSVVESFEWIRRITGIPLVVLAIEGLPRILGYRKKREGSAKFYSIMGTIYLLWIITAFLPNPH